MESMSSNTKLEIAVEIIATMIAIYLRDGYKVEDEEVKNLLKEREEMYKGNEMVIDKIIDVYGPKIKINYEDI